MFGAIGLVVILVCVFGSFVWSGGKMEVVLHALPHEMMAIGGAAVGAFLVANSMGVVKLAGRGLVQAFKGSRWTQPMYRDLLSLLFLLLSTYKQRGAMGLERHLDDAAASPIFQRFPAILADHHLVDFICDYGLMGDWDDAEQCCFIAVHRALESYDPQKAQFTTFVNWQIRGELQSLRFRLMTDQRPSAKKVEATTISLQSPIASVDGEEETTIEMMIADEFAEERTEAGASDYLARSAIDKLCDAYERRVRAEAIEQVRRRQPKRALAKALVATAHLPGAERGVAPDEVARIDADVARERALLAQRLFGDEAGTAQVTAVSSTASASAVGSASTIAAADGAVPSIPLLTAPTDPRRPVSGSAGVNSDQLRRLGKRAVRIINEIVDHQPGFALMRNHLAGPIADLPALGFVQLPAGSAEGSAGRPLPGASISTLRTNRSVRATRLEEAPRRLASGRG